MINNAKFINVLGRFRRDILKIYDYCCDEDLIFSDELGKIKILDEPLYNNIVLTMTSDYFKTLCWQEISGMLEDEDEEYFYSLSSITSSEDVLFMFEENLSFADIVSEEYIDFNDINMGLQKAMLYNVCNYYKSEAININPLYLYEEMYEKSKGCYLNKEYNKEDLLKLHDYFKKVLKVDKLFDQLTLFIKCFAKSNPKLFKNIIYNMIEEYYIENKLNMKEFDNPILEEDLIIKKLEKNPDMDFPNFFNQNNHYLKKLVTEFYNNNLIRERDPEKSRVIEHDDTTKNVMIKLKKKRENE